MVSTPGFKWLIALLLVYKTCERSMMTSTLFLVDHKVSQTVIGTWSSVINVSSILGSVYGGSTACRNTLRPYMAYRSVCIGLQCSLIVLWNSLAQVLPLDWLVTISFGLVTLTGFCAGVLTTDAFAIIIHVSKLSSSKPAVRSTCYVTLAAIEGVGKMVFATLAGCILDVAGLHLTYILFVVLSVLVIGMAQAQPITDFVNAV